MTEHDCEGFVDPRRGGGFFCRICDRSMTMREWRRSGPDPVETRSAEIIARAKKPLH
jgi:hypothetical protein